MEAQSAAVVASEAETTVLVAELERQIEEKRSEVRVTEEEVAQLSLRLREMEERVATEEQRLKEATAEAEERKAQQSQSQDDSCSLQRLFIGEHMFAQPQAAPEISAVPLSPVRTAVPDSPLAADAHAHAHRVPPVPRPLDANLANAFPMLGSAFNPHTNETNAVSHKLAPFSNDLASPSPLSPTGQSLIPSSLYESLGMPLSNKPLDSPVTASELSVSRSFQSEDDVILDRNWLSRRNSTAGGVGQQVVFGAVQHSPASPVSTARGYDTLNVYDTDRPIRGRTTPFGMDAQRASFSSKLPAATTTLDFALL